MAASGGRHASPPRCPFHSFGRWLLASIRHPNWRLMPALVVAILAATATEGSAQPMDSSRSGTRYPQEHLKRRLDHEVARGFKWIGKKFMSFGNKLVLTEQDIMTWVARKKHEDPDELYRIYQYFVLGMILAIVIQRAFALDLFPKMKEDFVNTRKHLGEWEGDDDVAMVIRPKRAWRRKCIWLRWVLGPVLGALLILDAAPQIMFNPEFSHQKMNLVQTVIGFTIFVKKITMMEGQTIEGNKASVFAGMKDTTWGYYILLCAVAQAGLLVFLGLKRYCFGGEDGDLGGIIRAIIYWTLSAFHVTFCFCVARREHFASWWFHVRTYAEKGNMAIDPSFADVVTTTIEPSKIWDRFLLHHRMQARMEDHACQEWKESKHLKYITAPELMVLEEKLFRQPVVNDIDAYTRLMIFFTKAMQVEEGRLNPVNIKEVNKPWAKRHIRSFKAPICGLRIAEWDELYSEDGVVLKTESSGSFKTALNFLHWEKLFHKNETPIFFDNELEGVMAYEAVVASWAADCNVRWKDLVSDVAFEKMAFGGILQSYLVGKSSDTFKQAMANPKYRGKLSPSTYYICDYTWIGEYKAKDNCLSYGFLACFDSHKKLQQIYVCHCDRVINKFTLPPGRKADYDYKNDENYQWWEHAKYVIKATVGAGHTLNEHLLCCHFIVSNTAALASRTTLEWDHPIRRFLQTFTMRTPSINFAATLTLTPEDRFAHRASSLEYGEFARLFEDCAKKWKMDTFPETVKANHLEDTPWAEDGQKLWKVIKEFTKTYVTLFYGVNNDDAVRQDEELKAFWSMVDSMPRGPEGSETEDKAQPGYGYKLKELNFQNLVDYLTHVIFWVTGNHEYFGALAEYFTTPAGLSTKIYDHEHKRNPKMENKPQVMNDVQTYMQDLCIISATGVPQPKLISEWDHLMHLPKIGPRKPLKAVVRRWPIIRLILHQDASGDEPREEWADMKMDTRVVEVLKEYTKKISDSTATGTESAKLPCFNSKYKFESTEDLLKCKDKIERQNKVLSVVHAAFMEDLHDLDAELKKKNEERVDKGGIPFEAFRPMNLECSVNI